MTKDQQKAAERELLLAEADSFAHDAGVSVKYIFITREAILRLMVEFAEKKMKEQAIPCA